MDTVHSGMAYNQPKRFCPLKCLNWNLGASHLPEVCWNGLESREGREEGDKLNCLLPLSSFILWSAHWAHPARSETKSG
jgi:hypothetical protein